MKFITHLLISTILLFLFQCKSSNEVSTDQPKSHYKKIASQSGIDTWISDNLDLVVKIQATVFYRTYRFDPTETFTKDSLHQQEIANLAVSIQTQTESSSGTAVVMAKSQHSAALLSANHVVNYPDTIWHSLAQSPEPQNRSIEAISVKVRERFAAFVGSKYGPADLIVQSNKDDLAVLSSQFNVGGSLLPGSIKAGDSDKLDWADFVYAVGFPKGSKMITSGIVSKTNRLMADGFSIDAPFNRGFSGGLVLAINRQTSEPEWVGMLTSATADINYELEPREMILEEYAPELPYTGTIFVKRKSNINYGITHAVSMAQIRTFLNENSSILEDKGFDIEEF